MPQWARREGSTTRSVATESSSSALPGRIASQAKATVRHHTQPARSSEAPVARKFPNHWIHVPRKGITRKSVGTKLSMQWKPTKSSTKPSTCSTRWMHCWVSSAWANISASDLRDSASSYTSMWLCTAPSMRLQQAQQPPPSAAVGMKLPMPPSSAAAASSMAAVDCLPGSSGSRPGSARPTLPPLTAIRYCSGAKVSPCCKASTVASPHGTFRNVTRRSPTRGGRSFAAVS
mmetsp:Transcript_11155/g.28778  ORF Transcript_11155/g.28778 Transcript_11155/m.28778 type:complete len:232 (+) Transcript_11155:105-800(+)